jgi:mannose-1-phosphate guanylyltransferase/mannose-6-phosphate isomerase
MKHKIINTSVKDNLVFSEVQLGEYFGEDDIIRHSDKYGRT